MGLTVPPIGSFFRTELDGVLFLLLFPVICCSSDVLIVKLSPYPYKTEALKFSMLISISEGFYIWVLLLDILVTGIDPDLSAFSTVSFFLFLKVTTASGDF